MGVVLVVEPEASQAEQLRRVLRKRVHSELLLVSSTAAAIEAMHRGIPDLILVSALLSPKDEDRLMAHLRSLEGAAHLQTLTIPQLATSSRRAEQTTVLDRFRKKKAAAPGRGGCDPKVFAEEISVQLARALEIRKHPPVEQVFKPSAVEPIMEPSFVEPTAVEPAFAEPIFRSAMIEEEMEPDFTSAILESAFVESAAAPPVITPIVEPALTPSRSFGETDPDFTSAIFKSAFVESAAPPSVTEQIY